MVYIDLNQIKEQYKIAEFNHYEFNQVKFSVNYYLISY